jgi:hypothetical protein
MWRREEDRWVDVLPWTPSVAVKHGNADNALTVAVVGGVATFTVNGGMVSQLAIGLPSGHVGVYVGGDGNQVVLEHFRVVKVK